MTWSQRMFDALVNEMCTISLTGASVNQRQRWNRLRRAYTYLIRRTERWGRAELEPLVQT